ncbi:MAG: hypothetical protein GX902_04470 [Lentisphaerae bacterium]|nr:hypothetical protein [Lentisphaerota bacterium]
MNALELLSGDAAAARAVLSEKPELSREEYRRLAWENNQRRQWDYRQDELQHPGGG